MEAKFKTLKPPRFTESGESLTKEEAIEKGAWIATVNLWIMTAESEGEPSILYQQRSLSYKWAPGKLDVVIAGKVSDGESNKEALIRGAKEELNLEVNFSDLTYIGRRIHVGVSDGRYLNTVPHIYFTIFNRALTEYKLNEKNIEAIYKIPIRSLVNIHEDKEHSFSTSGYNYKGEKVVLDVTKDLFPENWDNYHYKIALLADKFVRGEEVIY